VGFEPVFTLIVVVLMLVAMVRELLPADMVLLAALAALLLGGVVDLDTALRGFSNPTLLTIGALFVVAAALRDSGALSSVGDRILGSQRVLRTALARLGGIVAASSAFLNNTAIVAMGVPAVVGWCRERRLSSSKLLIPLSYASVLGGLCTLTGTSTNLVADSMLRAHGLRGLGFFEIAWIGLPCALIGLTLIVVLGPIVLPARDDVRADREQDRRDQVEFVVRQDSPLVDKTAAQAGLSDVPRLELVGVSRQFHVPHGLPEREPLREGDRITFRGRAAAEQGAGAGVGLGTAAAEGTHDRETGHELPALREAVIPDGSSLIDATMESADFPGRFGAAAVGVRRGGAVVQGWSARDTLHRGDTVLLETEPGVPNAVVTSPELVVVDGEGRETREDPRWLRSRRFVSQGAGALITVALLAAVVVTATLQLLPIAVSALSAAVAMVALRLISPGDARRSVNWSVLLVIGSALGLSAALEETGAAAWIGQGLVSIGGRLGPTALLAMCVAGTMLFTLVLTNTAAVALMFPIVSSAAAAQGLDPRPFAIAATVAASLAFSTPLAYQTNLMVCGPGGYRFSDFARLGVPLQLVLGAVAVWLIPLVWPF
jgi:di/tricarboxylate transporter